MKQIMFFKQEIRVRISHEQVIKATTQHPFPGTYYYFNRLRAKVINYDTRRNLCTCRKKAKKPLSAQSAANYTGWFFKF